MMPKWRTYSKEGRSASFLVIIIRGLYNDERSEAGLYIKDHSGQQE